jgi:Fe-S-cluster containining protein
VIERTPVSRSESSAVVRVSRRVIAIENRPAHLSPVDSKALWFAEATVYPCVCDRAKDGPGELHIPWNLGGKIQTQKCTPVDALGNSRLSSGDRFPCPPLEPIMTLDPTETEGRTAQMIADGTDVNRGSESQGQLCLSCGLCCDGSFFGSVELRAGDDVTGLGELLPLERKAGKIMFRQPCSALQGRCCSVYENRPQVCRRYRCRVLRSVEAAPATLPDAREKVSALRASFAALKEKLRQAGLLTLDLEFPAAIKAFRVAYTAALNSGDAVFWRSIVS